MKSANILIVEDEQSLAYTLSRAIQRANGAACSVKISRSAEAALILLANQQFDLVITDWRLPGMSGMELIQKIRQSYENVFVILMTAFGTEALEREARAVSDGYLTKPFELTDLLDSVHEILQLPMVERESAPAVPISASILILEDDESLLSLYKKVFTQTGFRVATATTLAQASQHLKARPFDIFICDIYIGSDFGIDLLRVHQQALMQAGTQVLVITGDSRYKILSEDLGVNFFINKPVELGPLLMLVKSLAMRQGVAAP
jgi:DNA-binding response OmpR family regulator